MNVIFNGEKIQLIEHTLISFIESQGLTNKQGIAIAVNQEVVGRSNWTEFTLTENDEILVITAAAGG